MNHIAPVAEPRIREIPLSRLALAPENVRKTKPDARADAELKASIGALGLLENLVVRAAEPAEDGSEHFAVVAGGRRLAAMQALVEDKVFDANHPVPCQVRSGDAEPGEISLAENVVRIAMHPADQVTAFAKLVQAGQSVSAIAARFGVSERIVEQRLRLGNAAPELLDAYRADEIDLEVLKAFAVTTDRERQMAVWEQVSGQGYRPAAWQVKRLLTEERVPGASAVARFVGVDAYEAAGGQVLRDLFARDDETGVWFEDPVLLEKLAMAKLQAAADERRTVFDGLPTLHRARWLIVGRLDINSSGLLMFTNEGGLANRLMHPSTGLDREYAVRVDGVLDDAALDTLKAGVEVDGEVQGFSDIRYYDGRGSNHWYHVVLMEGRNREVRKLFEQVGRRVTRLKRVRFGPVVLPAWLRRGRTAELGPRDLAALHGLLRLPYTAPPRGRGAERKPGRSLLIPYPELPP